MVAATARTRTIDAVQERLDLGTVEIEAAVTR